MKIKPPPIPPSGKGAEGAKPVNIKAKTTQVAAALAGLLGGEETKRKEEKSKETKELSDKEKRKKLQAFGGRCGIKADDNPRRATYKMVHYVCADQYDRSEEGFKKMVDRITDFIQETPQEKQKFDQWISVIQSET